MAIINIGELEIAYIISIKYEMIFHRKFSHCLNKI